MRNQTGLNEEANCMLKHIHKYPFSVWEDEINVSEVSSINSNLILYQQLCEDLFTKINDSNTDNSMSYSVEVKRDSLCFS